MSAQAPRDSAGSTRSSGHLSATLPLNSLEDTLNVRMPPNEHFKSRYVRLVDAELLMWASSEPLHKPSVRLSLSGAQISFPDTKAAAAASATSTTVITTSFILCTANEYTYELQTRDERAMSQWVASLMKVISSLEPASPLPSSSPANLRKLVLTPGGPSRGSSRGSSPAPNATPPMSPSASSTASSSSSTSVTRGPSFNKMLTRLKRLGGKGHHSQPQSPQLQQQQAPHQKSSLKLQQQQQQQQRQQQRSVFHAYAPHPQHGTGTASRDKQHVRASDPAKQLPTTQYLQSTHSKLKISPSMPRRSMMTSRKKSRGVLARGLGDCFMCLRDLSALGRANARVECYGGATVLLDLVCKLEMCMRLGEDDVVRFRMTKPIKGFAEAVISLVDTTDTLYLTVDPATPWDSRHITAIRNAMVALQQCVREVSADAADEFASVTVRDEATSNSRHRRTLSNELDTFLRRNSLMQDFGVASPSELVPAAGVQSSFTADDTPVETHLKHTRARSRSIASVYQHNAQQTRNVIPEHPEDNLDAIHETTAPGSTSSMAATTDVIAASKRFSTPLINFLDNTTARSSDTMSILMSSSAVFSRLSEADLMNSKARRSSTTPDRLSMSSDRLSTASVSLEVPAMTSPRSVPSTPHFLTPQASVESNESYDDVEEALAMDELLEMEIAATQKADGEVTEEEILAQDAAAKVARRRIRPLSARVIRRSLSCDEPIGDATFEATLDTHIPEEEEEVERLCKEEEETVGDAPLIISTGSPSATTMDMTEALTAEPIHMHSRLTTGSYENISSSSTSAAVASDASNASQNDNSSATGDDDTMTGRGGRSSFGDDSVVSSTDTSVSHLLASSTICSQGVFSDDETVVRKSTKIHRKTRRSHTIIGNGEARRSVILDDLDKRLSFIASASEGGGADSDADKEQETKEKKEDCDSVAAAAVAALELDATTTETDDKTHNGKAAQLLLTPIPNEPDYSSSAGVFSDGEYPDVVEEAVVTANATTPPSAANAMLAPDSDLEEHADAEEEEEEEEEVEEIDAVSPGGTTTTTRTVRKKKSQRVSQHVYDEVENLVTPEVLRVAAARAQNPNTTSLCLPDNDSSSESDDETSAEKEVKKVAAEAAKYKDVLILARPLPPLPDSDDDDGGGGGGGGCGGGAGDHHHHHHHHYHGGGGGGSGHHGADGSSGTPPMPKPRTKKHSRAMELVRGAVKGNSDKDKGGKGSSGKIYGNSKTAGVGEAKMGPVAKYYSPLMVTEIIEGISTKTVKGGTLDALVRYLTSRADSDFVNCFLTTYRSMVSPEMFLEKLIERYREPLDNDLTSTEIQMLTINVLIKFATGSWEDFTDDMLSSLLRPFIYSVMRQGNVALVGRLRNAVMAQRCPELSTQKHQLAQSRPPQPIVPYDIATRPPLDLFEVSSEELARQITVVDNKLYRQINVSELLEWNKEQSRERSPNVFELIDRSNRMTWWVVDNILSYDTAQQRAKMMGKMVAIARYLYKLNNCNSLVAVVAGLNSSAITRLKKTLAEQPKLDRELLKKFELLMDSSHSMKNYRDFITTVKPPCVPWLGVSLKDITFTLDGNSDWIGPSDGRIINFQKRRFLYNIVQDIRTFQLESYVLTEVPQLIKLFNEFKHRTPDELYERSLVVEPRESKAPRPVH